MTPNPTVTYTFAIVEFRVWSDWFSIRCWRFVLAALLWPANAIGVCPEITECYRLCIRWKGRDVWEMRLR